VFYAVPLSLRDFPVVQGVSALNESRGDGWKIRQRRRFRRLGRL